MTARARAGPGPPQFDGAPVRLRAVPTCHPSLRIHGGEEPQNPCPRRAHGWWLHGWRSLWCESQPGTAELVRSQAMRSQREARGWFVEARGVPSDLLAIGNRAAAPDRAAAPG